MGAAADPAHKKNFASLLEYSKDKDAYLYPVALPKPAKVETTARSGAEAGPSKAYRSFASEVNETLAALKRYPSLLSLLRSHELQPVELSSGLTLSNERVSLEFDNITGAIISMVEKEGPSAGREWARRDKPLGQFVYRTYT